MDEVQVWWKEGGLLGGGGQTVYLYTNKGKDLDHTAPSLQQNDEHSEVSLNWAEQSENCEESPHHAEY